MSRIPLLPENDLVEQISSIQHDVDELKRAQRAGSTMVETFVTQGADRVFTLGSLFQTTINITFTSNVQSYPLTSLSYQIFSGGSELDPSMTTTWPILNVKKYASDITTPQKETWRILFTNNASSTMTFTFRIFVQSTDKGTIS